jgi:regulator of cell morphogenesis and NO signaling
MNISINETLGSIVSKHPNTVNVLNRYKIDYCCGGKTTLKDAINNLGLDATKVINELQLQIVRNDGVKAVDWEKQSLTQIVDYILDTHHGYLKETLAEVNELMFKILKVHYRTDGQSLLVIHKLFGTLKTELEAHLVKEEENLFLLIKRYDETGERSLLKEIKQFIKDTEDEHDAAGDLFKALEKETNDFTAPKGACYSYNRTFELLDALEKDTFNHIHMENSVLFLKI